MKRIIKKTVAITPVAILFSFYGCQKDDSIFESKKTQLGEVSDSLVAVFANTGIKFPKVVEGRLAFASEQEYISYIDRLSNINMGDLNDFARMNCFISLNLYEQLDDEAYLSAQVSDDEFVDIGDPYFKSVLNVNKEFQIDNKIVKVTNNFVFVFTIGRFDQVQKFKEDFTTGGVNIEIDSTLQYSKDLLVYRVVPIQGGDKVLFRKNETEIKSNAFGHSNKRIVLQQWHENWLLHKTTGLKIEFQQKKNVGNGWKNIDAGQLLVTWKNLSVCPYSTPIPLQDAFIIGWNEGTIGHVFFKITGAGMTLGNSSYPGFIGGPFPFWCGGPMKIDGTVNYGSGIETISLNKFWSY